MKQRKFYGKARQKYLVVNHAKQLLQQQGVRAIQLAPKKGLPKRVKPQAVPYGKYDLAKLKADRENALQAFRTDMAHRLERKDIPEHLTERVSRLKSRTIILERKLIGLRRRILKLQGPAATGYVFRTSGERAALQKELDQVESELDRAYSRMARILTRGEKGRRKNIIQSYEDYLNARAAERQGIAEVTGQIVGGRKALRAALRAKRPKGTREPTEGQRELLRAISGEPRPLSQPPPTPDPRKVMARVDQILNEPYTSAANRSIGELQDDLRVLEAHYERSVGAAGRMSPTRAMREGSRIEKLRIKLHDAQTRYWHDAKNFIPSPEPSRNITEALAKANFDQLKQHQKFFRGSPLETMMRAVLDLETKATQEAADAGVGLFFKFPGFGIPLRVPQRVEKWMIDQMANLPPDMRAAVEYIGATKQIARDMFVTRYGPNAAVGAVMRNADSWVQTANGHIFDELRRMTQEAMGRGVIRRGKRAVGKGAAPAVKREDLNKLGHWLETGEFDDELSDGAKQFARDLQDLVERSTNDYLMAGGDRDFKRLGSSYVFHMIKNKDWNHLEELSVEPDAFVFGNNPVFARSRPDEKATMRHLKNEGFDIEENIVLLTYGRLAAHNRAIADLAASRSILDKFGVKAKRKPPGDYVQVSAEDGTLPINKMHQKTRTERYLTQDVYQQAPIRDIFQLDKGVWLPEDVAKTLIKMQYIRQQNARSIYKKLRRMNSWWKQWALFTTGYDIRNQIGDMYLLGQSKMQPFRSVVRGLIMLKGSEKVARTGPQFVADLARRAIGRKPAARKGMTYKQLREEAALLGVPQRAQLTQEAEAHLTGAAAQSRVGSTSPTKSGPVMRAKYRGRGIRVGRENLNRLGAYGQQVVSKRQNPYLASRRVNEAVFDYGDVGSIVQALRTSPLGVPFATWLAKNLPAQVKRLPSRTNVELLALNQELARQATDPTLGEPSFGNQPEYLALRNALAIPGINRFGYSGIPVSDLNKLLPVSRGGVPTPTSLDAIRELGKQWAPELGPVPQLAYAALSNTQPLTGQEFRGRVPASATDLAFKRLLDTAGLSGGMQDYVRVKDYEGGEQAVPAVSGFQKFVLDTLFPPAANISRLQKYDAPGIDRTQVGPAKIDLWQALGTLGGLTTRPIWDRRSTEGVKLAAEYDRRDALGELTSHAKDLKAAGMNVRVQTDPKTNLIVSYEPPQLRNDVIKYNRIVARLMEAVRISEGIKAKAGRP
jgi:hypothetical protein